MNYEASFKSSIVALLVLLAVHTCVSVAAYRFLTRSEKSVTGGIAETTTPDQLARGEKSFRGPVTTTRTTIPLAVYFYIIFGYAGLVMAVVMIVYNWLRHQI